jgi:hypothetical protein
MVSLKPEEKEILELYTEGSRLKDVACKSVDDIDAYLTAAELLHRAAALSAECADSAGIELDDKLQHHVFGEYYSYEEQYCLGGYYYEKRDTRSSTKHLKLGASHLSNAISLVENAPPSLSREVKEHLDSLLPDWRHFQRHIEIKLLANEAREAWDSERFVDALDVYRKMATRQREFIESEEFKRVSSRCQRIAVANFIGSMANASSAMAGTVLGRGKVIGPDGAREIPFDLLVKLIEYTLDSYRFSNAAFDENPEWDQYRAIAQQSLANIENFLKSNPSAREPLSIAFDGDPDFVKILKMTDTKSGRRTDKIKILLLSANPVGTDMLSLDEEVRAITQKVRAAEHRDLIEIVPAGAVRPDDLLQTLNEHRPHVVQFSGHGSAGEEIVVCDDAGNPKPISKDALVALFESTRSNVRVVVLNSCYSRAQAEAIVSEVPCAIGMNDSVGDRAAIIFAASFYRAVAFGLSVGTAFKQGITALKLEGIAQDNIPELVAQAGIDPEKVFVLNP